MHCVPFCGEQEKLLQLAATTIVNPLCGTLGAQKVNLYYGSIFSKPGMNHRGKIMQDKDG